MDTLQRQIYFLTLWNHKETYKVLIDYITIGGEDIKYHVKKTIVNILHENIDVHSRRLISEVPGDGVKLISKL